MGKGVLTAIGVGILTFVSGGLAAGGIAAAKFGALVGAKALLVKGLVFGALAGGLTAYQSAKAKKAIRAANALQTREVVQQLSTAPALMGYGEVEIGGILAYPGQSFFNNWESVPGGQGTGKTLFTLHRAIACAKRPGGMAEFMGVRLNEEYYPASQLRNDNANFAGYLTSAGAKVYELTNAAGQQDNWYLAPDSPNRGGKFGTAIRQDSSGSNEHPGFQPVAMSWGLGDGGATGKNSARPDELIAKFPHLGADFRGDDLAWVHMQYRLIDGFMQGKSEVGGSERLFANLPREKFRWRLAKVYDPRNNAHDFADPTTWEWSDNPAICYADYLTQHFGAAFEDINWPSIIAAANACDMMVPINEDGDLEKRFRLDVALSGQDSHEDNIALILNSFGGTPTYSEGRFGLAPITWSEPVTTITRRDLLAPLRFSSNEDLQSRVNSVDAVYTSRDHAFSDVTVLPQKSLSLINRDGQELKNTLALPSVSRGTQAQRICHRLVQLQFAQERIVISTKFSAAKLNVGDRFTMQDELLFPSGKVFRVEQISVGGKFPATIEAVEDSQTYWEDLPVAGYHAEAEDGVVTQGVVRPARPTGFRAEGRDGEIRWSWDSLSPNAIVRLYSTTSDRWSDPEPIWAGNAESYTEKLPDIQVDTRKYGWVDVVVDGLASRRSPTDDTTTVTAVAAVPRNLHNVGPLGPNECPDANLGFDGNRAGSDDGRLWLKHTPPRTPFDSGIIIGERSGVWWQADSPSFSLPSDIPLAYAEDLFRTAVQGYVSGSATVDADTGAVSLKFYPAPNDDGYRIPADIGTQTVSGATLFTEAELRLRGVDAANGPVVWRHASPDDPLSNQVAWARNGIDDGPVIPSRYIVGGGAAYLRNFAVIRVTSGNDIYITLAESNTANRFASGPQFTAGARRDLRFILSTAGVPDVIVSIGDADTTEPYFYRSSNPAEVNAWAEEVAKVAGSPSITITIFDDALNQGPTTSVALKADTNRVAAPQGRVRLFFDPLGALTDRVKLPTRYVEGGGGAWLLAITLRRDSTTDPRPPQIDFATSPTSRTQSMVADVLTDAAVSGLRFLLRADGLDDLVLRITDTDGMNPYALTDSDAYQAWANALLAKPEDERSASITVFDVSALPQEDGLQLGAFLSRALRLAVRRGAQEAVYGAFASSMGNAYTATLPSGTAALLAAETGNYEWAIINPSDICKFPNGAATPLLLHEWELQGRAGLVAYHASAFWRGEAGEYLPSENGMPADIRVTGRWEADGITVAAVTATFGAQVEGATGDSLRITLEALNRYESVTPADGNRVRSNIDLLELIFYYNEVPLFITASRGQLGAGRNPLVPSPRIPGAPGPLTLTDVPSHRQWGFTFPQTDPEYTRVEFRYQLAEGAGVVAANPNLYSLPITTTTGSVTITGLRASTPYIIEARPINDIGTGEITTVRRMTQPNAPPVVDAGDDQGVVSGATVTLDGSATLDPNTPPDPLNFRWDQFSPETPTPALTGGTTNTATFTAPSEGGLYEFSLEVSDDQGGSASDQTKVAVSSVAVTFDANGCPIWGSSVRGDHALHTASNGDETIWRHGFTPAGLTDLPHATSGTAQRRVATRPPHPA